MMNQNANEILSAGAKPPLAGEHVWPGELPYETA